ncbi:uncharacterized protein LOC141607838 [Silene latifolia]|uniref:uncharacterized protein LOC141607838 n=1 Tax=Silene latifolia TaxID=37657 RepID=UPI003D78A4D0
MGTFIGHAVPGTLFLLVGLWHLWCTILRYVSNPNNSRVRVWNPVPGFNNRIKYLELYTIVIGTFIDLCAELLYSPHPKYFVNGVLDSAHLYCFEHAGMIVMFFIFGLVSLVSVKTSYLPMPDGALCFVIAAAFSSEYLLFHFHSTSHKGMEGHYHFILLMLIALSIITSILGAFVPSSFPVDLSSGIALTMQGLWFYQTAFTLYGPMMPEGCEQIGDNIVCSLSDSLIRGELLANFQLFTLVVGVFVLIALSYSFAYSRFGRSREALAES